MDYTYLTIPKKKQKIDTIAIKKAKVEKSYTNYQIFSLKDVGMTIISILNFTKIKSIEKKS